MTNTTTTTYGGYAVTHLREAGGEETLRFDAYVTLHGRKVLYVSGDGHGGSIRRQPVNEQWATFAQVEADFDAFATHWNAGSEYAGFEDGDQLICRLIEVAALNKKRTVMFLLDDEDYFATGMAHQFRTGVTFDDAVAHLSGPQYADGYPRIWSKADSDFVPVAGLPREGR